MYLDRASQSNQTVYCDVRLNENIQKRHANINICL